MFEHRILAQEDKRADVLRQFKNTAECTLVNYSKQTSKAR